MKNHRYIVLPDGSRVPHALLSPITVLMKSLSSKWKLEILFAIHEGHTRFGALTRAIPGITQHMLASRLSELAKDGFVTRHDFEEVPHHVEYELTPATRDLKPIFDALVRWAQRHNPMLLPDPGKREKPQD